LPKPAKCRAIPSRATTKEAAMKVNYLAVFISALMYWWLGALWYGVFFSKQWMALENLTPAQARGTGDVALPYVITFILNLLIAYVLAVVCSWRKANTFVSGAAVGVLLWIGILGPVAFTTYMYEMRSKELFAINEFYPLVGLCLMGAILGAWTKKSA
jgi:surface polysaccharide O-acyltransferase-like enzyme